MCRWFLLQCIFSSENQQIIDPITAHAAIEDVVVTASKAVKSYEKTEAFFGNGVTSVSAMPSNEFFGVFRDFMKQFSLVIPKRPVSRASIAAPA